MENGIAVKLAPNANRALIELADRAATLPADLLDDAVACLMAGRGIQDFIAGTGPARFLPRGQKGVVSWTHLDQAKRVVEAMQARVELAWAMLHRASLAKARYSQHQDLWSRVLSGVSLVAEDQ